MSFQYKICLDYAVYYGTVFYGNQDIYANFKNSYVDYRILITGQWTEVRGGKVFHLPARLSLTVPCCFLFRPLRPLSRNAVRCSHAPPSTAPAPSTAPPATTAPPASVLCPTRTAPPPPSRPSACPRRRRHVRAPPASTRPAPPPSSHSPWSCRLPCSVTAVSAVDSVVK